MLSGSSEAGGSRELARDPAARTVRGRVLACFHNEWEVAFGPDDVCRCRARGKHFIQPIKGKKPIVPGDEVEVTRLQDGSSVIERVLPRETVLSRLLPGTRRVVEQVIVANARQLVVVASVARPRLNRRLLDRFLVIAESAGLTCAVVLNKTDLEPEDAWRPLVVPYEAAGYAVLPTCALDGSGVGALFEQLEGTFSVLAGPSGAGKSSLLNTIEPGLGLRVREISRKSQKGKHTTTNVTVFRLGADALVADTPGFRELGFWRISPGELGGFFPEFGDFSPSCRFRGCAHAAEPDCAVKEAVEAGAIDSGRYENYLRLLAELKGRGL